MMIATFPDLVFKAETMADLTCAACGKAMELTVIEPISKGFEIRSFVCVPCDALEEFVTEL